MSESPKRGPGRPPGKSAKPRDQMPRRSVQSDDLPATETAARERGISWQAWMREAIRAALDLHRSRTDSPAQ